MRGWGKQPQLYTKPNLVSVCLAIRESLITDRAAYIRKSKKGTITPTECRHKRRYCRLGGSSYLLECCYFADRHPDPYAAHKLRGILRIEALAHSVTAPLAGRGLNSSAGSSSANSTVNPGFRPLWTDAEGSRFRANDIRGPRSDGPKSLVSRGQTSYPYGLVSYCAR